MRVRGLEALIQVDDPAWPALTDLFARSTVPVRVLPLGDPAAGPTTLYRLQVTARSFLGALALNCGGVLVDDGWVRLLGGGTTVGGDDASGLPDLATANGLGDPEPARCAPSTLIVGFDVLGGTFAINPAIGPRNRASRSIPRCGARRDRTSGRPTAGRFPSGNWSRVTAIWPRSSRPWATARPCR
jgi:Protein of unknown function DUF2625